jgi:hypothetical protein
MIDEDRQAALELIRGALGTIGILRHCIELPRAANGLRAAEEALVLAARRLVGITIN